MKDLKNIKVLIAEDDYLVAEEIVRVLLIKGFKVLVQFQMVNRQ